MSYTDTKPASKATIADTFSKCQYPNLGHLNTRLMTTNNAIPATMSRSHTQRATLCDMRTVTHREMRNQSGNVLRHVADGETIQVTNHGRVAALIVPPGTDPLADLISRGQVRVARNPTSSLRSIVRRKSTADSQAIVSDVRGRW